MVQGMLVRFGKFTVLTFTNNKIFEK